MSRLIVLFFALVPALGLSLEPGPSPATDYPPPPGPYQGALRPVLAWPLAPPTEESAAFAEVDATPSADLAPVIQADPEPVRPSPDPHAPLPLEPDHRPVYQSVESDSFAPRPEPPQAPATTKFAPPAPGLFDDPVQTRFQPVEQLPVEQPGRLPPDLRAPTEQASAPPPTDPPQAAQEMADTDHAVTESGPDLLATPFQVPTEVSTRYGLSLPSDQVPEAAEQHQPATISTTSPTAAPTPEYDPAITNTSPPEPHQATTQHYPADSDDRYGSQSGYAAPSPYQQPVDLEPPGHSTAPPNEYAAGLPLNSQYPGSVYLEAPEFSHPVPPNATGQYPTYPRYPGQPDHAPGAVSLYPPEPYRYRGSPRRGFHLDLGDDMNPPEMMEEIWASFWGRDTDRYRKPVFGWERGSQPAYGMTQPWGNPAPMPGYPGYPAEQGSIGRQPFTMHNRLPAAGFAPQTSQPQGVTQPNQGSFRPR